MKHAMSSTLKDRLFAFSMHLALSCLLALCVMGLVFFVWYPSPLHNALGVMDIFLLLLLVDVVIGPLLTAIVFKKGKRTLILDLSIIALLQFSALAYGLYTLSESRPGWLVFGGYHFELVRVSEVGPNERPSTLWSGPLWAAIPLANNLDKILGVNTGQDPYYQPARYVKLESQLDRLRSSAQPLRTLKNSSNTDHDVAAIIKRWPQADAWIPLSGGELNMVVLIQRHSGAVVTIADLRPW